MREVDLSKYNVRTDLVSDLVKTSKEGRIYYEKSVKVLNMKVDNKASIKLKVDKGYYTTIYFNDITDNTNYEKVLKILTREIKKMLRNLNIKKNASCMIIGLGNENSTADELGVKTAKKVIITNHINELIGDLEKGYRITTLFTPGVMGDTGIETSDTIDAVIKKVRPDFIIVIDALASFSLDKLLKTIQITSAGIKPGSGIGNKRKELSSRVYKIPIISIGVPTVVESSVIVLDALSFLEKEKQKSIFNEINLDNNLIVTPKDVDFIVSKLSILISSAINNSLHNISTKNE